MLAVRRGGLFVLAGCLLVPGPLIASALQDQGPRPAGAHQDNTEGKTWIQRLERPDRLPGLKLNEVVACLKLKPGDVVADIGSGVGVFTIAFAKAVAPSGKALAVDIWPDLLAYVDQKAKKQGVNNLQTILAAREDPKLPKGQVDVVFFHDVFHNMNDRQGYLKILASYLKPTSRIAIVEQEYDDPISKKWDKDEDRIKKEQVDGWMAKIGFQLVGQYDIFEGAKNPPGTGMPARWFVVYAKRTQAAR